MLILFTIGVILYTFGVSIAALFGNEKAKKWLNGRWKQMKELRFLRREKRSEEPLAIGDGDWIWFHAASLGEFEQGRPVIEAIKHDFPHYKILLSFFSPSGYEVRKNYPLADEVLYLPSDTALHAKKWLDRHHFVAAFFIKYEFWFNYMKALKKKNIPLFYISLIFNHDSYFFKPYGKWFLKQLTAVTHFFVQDAASEQLLVEHGFNNVTRCGDTRFDRVIKIKQRSANLPVVKTFVDDKPTFIAGSSWQPDEDLLSGFIATMPDDYCVILAPHDVSESHVAQIKGMFPDALLYSEFFGPCHTEAQPRVSMGMKPTSKVLLINTIGILSQLYQYARFVYIGGGFGVGIHNIQEPVAFGCPVVFGPNHKGFKEAVDLVELKGAFCVNDAAALASVFDRLMNDKVAYSQASTACRDYLNSQLGATEKVLKGFKKVLFS